MILPPAVRKFTLTAHVLSSVGLLGAVAAFLALAIAGLTSDNLQRIRSAYVAMYVIAWAIIVPLAFAGLFTGLVQSLGTGWGLFRHWWVLMKLLVTIFVIVILLLQMESLSYVASVAAEGALSSDDLRGARMSLVVHAGGGLAVLLLPMVLSIYKPRGLTRYGWRKQDGRRPSTGAIMPSIDSRNAEIR